MPGFRKGDRKFPLSYKWDFNEHHHLSKYIVTVTAAGWNKDLIRSISILYNNIYITSNKRRLDIPIDRLEYFNASILMITM